MRCRNLLTLILLAATACASPGRPPGAVPQMVAGAQLIGTPPTAIRVVVEQVSSERPVERIILVGPNGVSVEAVGPLPEDDEGSGDRDLPPAPELDAAAGKPTQPSLFYSPSTGESRPTRDAWTVTALLPLPDPEAYLAAPEDWFVIVATRYPTGRTIAYQFSAPRL